MWTELSHKVSSWGEGRDQTLDRSPVTLTLTLWDNQESPVDLNVFLDSGRKPEPGGSLDRPRKEDPQSLDQVRLGRKLLQIILSG